MPCTVLPSNIVGNQQAPGQSVSPRGDWSGRFFGVPQCVKNPINPLNDRAWDAIENNIIVGNPQVQNAWPPFAQRPYTGPPPPPPGNAGPSLVVGPARNPGTGPIWLADTSLNMNIFVDDCILQGAYPVPEWSVTGPFPLGIDACVYAFVVIAPQGTPTIMGRGGSTVLNYCPTIIAEIDGAVAPMTYAGPGWRPCSYQTGFPPNTVSWNLCPPTAPGYFQCSGPTPMGQTASVAAIDVTSQGTFTWMRNQFFETQVHYLIPSILDPTKHLYVASQIQTKQVM